MRERPAPGSDLEVRRRPAPERIVHGIAVRPVDLVAIVMADAGAGHWMTVVRVAGYLAGYFSAVLDVVVIVGGSVPVWPGAVHGRLNRRMLRL